MLNAPAPSSLAPDALARRLRELVANERACRTHNQLSAEDAFGAEYMARFRAANGLENETGVPVRVRLLIPG